MEDAKAHSDKPELDAERVTQLLHIHEKTLNQPLLKRIHDWAMGELKKHDEGLVPKPIGVDEGFEVTDQIGTRRRA